MVVNIVTIHVKPEHVRSFLEATLENHKGSRSEPGNRRFDILQSDGEAGRFVLYEAFESPEAVEAHRHTSHYLAWRSKVEPWMAKPREGRTHSVIAPTDSAAW